MQSKWWKFTSAQNCLRISDTKKPKMRLCVRINPETPKTHKVRERLYECK